MLRDALEQTADAIPLLADAAMPTAAVLGNVTEWITASLAVHAANLAATDNATAVEAMELASNATVLTVRDWLVESAFNNSVNITPAAGYLAPPPAATLDAIVALNGAAAVLATAVPSAALTTCLLYTSPSPRD